MREEKGIITSSFSIQMRTVRKSANVDTGKSTVVDVLYVFALLFFIIIDLLLLFITITILLKLCNFKSFRFYQELVYS